MTYGVGNNGDRILRTADIGGQRLLGVESLSNFINYGNSSLEKNVQSDTFVSNAIDKTSTFGAKFVNFLGKIPHLLAGGIGIFYIVKTGKIPKIFNAIKSFGSNIGKTIGKIFKKGA